MDVQTISMTPEAATAKLEAYKKRLAKMRHSKAQAEVRREYEAALQGYKQLAKGAVLIDLDDVISSAPVDEKNRPKLAICRADRKQVRLLWDANSSRATFMCVSQYQWNPTPHLSVTVQMGRQNTYVLLNKDNQRFFESSIGYSIVPMVPLDVRPKTGQLKDQFILWEVEKWSDTQIRATPDRDPYLLKHIGGSLYAVLAEWDLTDLERSIIKGRVS